jgi:hypothetical protein
MKYKYDSEMYRLQWVSLATGELICPKCHKNNRLQFADQTLNDRPLDFNPDHFLMPADKDCRDETKLLCLRCVRRLFIPEGSKINWETCYRNIN